MARHQTHARGRRGRAWVEPEGNFAATLVFKPGCSVAEGANYSFVMGLAVSMALEAINAEDARQKPQLKWPNDVLLNGKKVAGILLESASQGRHLEWLTIGVGVNLVAKPDDTGLEQRGLPPTSVVEETSAQVSAEGLLPQLATSFRLIEHLYQTHGFAMVKAEWLTRAARLGEEITARLPREEVTGIFETVDDTGALVLNTREGRRVIPAADVYF